LSFHFAFKMLATFCPYSDASLERPCGKGHLQNSENCGFGIVINIMPIYLHLPAPSVASTIEKIKTVKTLKKLSGYHD